MKDDSQHGNCTFTERLENISFATVKNVRYEHLVEESVANKLQGNSPINRICIFYGECASASESACFNFVINDSVKINKHLEYIFLSVVATVHCRIKIIKNSKYGGFFSRSGHIF